MERAWWAASVASAKALWCSVSLARGPAMNYVPSRMMGMTAAGCGAEGRHIGVRTWVQLPQQLDGRTGPVGDDRVRKRIRLPLGYKGRVIWIQRDGCTMWRCGLGFNISMHHSLSLS